MKYLNEDRRRALRSVDEPPMKSTTSLRISRTRDLMIAELIVEIDDSKAFLPHPTGRIRILGKSDPNKGRVSALIIPPRNYAGLMMSTAPFAKMICGGHHSGEGNEPFSSQNSSRFDHSDDCSCQRENSTTNRRLDMMQDRIARNSVDFQAEDEYL